MWRSNASRTCRFRHHLRLSVTAMDAHPKQPEEDEYDSALDEDFNPEAIEGHQSENVDISNESETDDASGREQPVRGKRSAQDDIGFDNSGDETTIQKGQFKRRKKRKTSPEEEHDGPGGLIKTRAQRKLERQESKTIPSLAQPSVDVDTLWAQMSGPVNSTNSDTAALPSTLSAQPSSKTKDATENIEDGSVNGKHGPTSLQVALSQASSEPMVLIKRKVEFAGQTSEEERVVPASSAEAKVYLDQSKQHDAPKPGLRRPMKRKSAFDQPVPSDLPDKSKKLTTLEKSKLDWAAHVDKQGIADELTEQDRSKSNYLARMDFLSRMDSKRETDRHG